MATSNCTGADRARFNIPTDPQYYGPDATDTDALHCAEIIRAHCEIKYPNVEFRLDARGATDPETGDELRAEIRQWIDARWPDWCE